MRPPVTTVPHLSIVPPLIVPPLGLIVKYGTDVTTAEVETRVLIRERLQGRVPIPDVFGWAEDMGQNSFICLWSRAILYKQD